MGRRPGLSTVLILGSLVLVIAIFVGNSMGDRVLGQIASRGGGPPSPIPIPSSSATADSLTGRVLWKRRQVLSVATDPAFPDPRITPEPEIPATPRPAIRRKPRAAPTIAPDGVESGPPAARHTPNTTYTSPPMPIPMASAAPEETIAPDAAQTPAPRPVGSVRPSGTVRSAPAGRGTPTLPPVSVPSVVP